MTATNIDYYDDCKTFMFTHKNEGWEVERLVLFGIESRPNKDTAGFTTLEITRCIVSGFKFYMSSADRGLTAYYSDTFTMGVEAMNAIHGYYKEKGYVTKKSSNATRSICKGCGEPVRRGAASKRNASDRANRATPDKRVKAAPLGKPN